jgi:ribosomal RNA assembly protein
METLFVERTTEIKREKELLESELKVRIEIQGRKITIEGPALNEYEAKIILEAIGFGFSAKTALMLKEETFIFRIIKIKDVTRKKNIELVKSRIIGTYGKTKSTIESIADCKIVVQGNSVGIIGSAEEIEEATTAINNLIRGSKQSNVYKFLEKMNRERKKQ